MTCLHTNSPCCRVDGRVGTLGDHKGVCRVDFPLLQRHGAACNDGFVRLAQHRRPTAQVAAAADLAREPVGVVHLRQELPNRLG